MAAKSDITPEQIRKMFAYDAETGVLTWRPRDLNMFAGKECDAARAYGVWNARFAGKAAGNLNKYRGYIYININKGLYRAHRIIWCLVHGEWPPNEIDHINGNRADNRLENLRLATRSENMRNRVKSPKNSTGFKGVRFHKLSRKYAARITVHRKEIHLGLFEAPEDAFAAYCAAAKKYHGDFARTD